MAYGYADLGATELSDFALDKPLLGANVIPRTPSIEKWNTSAGGADRTETGFPIHRLRDGDVEQGTKPDSSQTAYYIEYGFSSAIEIDHVAVGPGHNLGTAAITTLQLQFDQDQDGAFTGIDRCNLAASLPLSDDDRIMQLELKPTGSITAYADAGGGQVTVTSNTHGMSNGEDITISGTVHYDGTYTISNVAANTFEITATWAGDDATGTWIVTTAKRFSDVTYVRLAMGKGSAFLPQITEFFLGARFQMPRWPNKPFNQKNIGNMGLYPEPSKGGVQDRIITAENQFRLQADWTMKYSEVDDLRTWWKKVRGTFVWVWEPSSAPGAFHVMSCDSERLDLPFEGWRKHSFTLEGVEQGPESAYLENE